MATDIPTETADPNARGDGSPLALTLVSAAIAAAVLFPLVWVFVAAFSSGPGALDALLRPTAVQVLINSLVLVTGVTVFSILVGVPLAYLVVRTDLPFPRLWTVLAALPLVIPSYIGAFAFDSAFGTSGEFNEILTPFGIPAVPEVSGLAGTVLVLTLYTYPYVFLTTRAALLSMDDSLVEAARSLGHSRASSFRRVTAPQIRPAVAAGALLVALYALSDFGTPAILQYDVFTRVIFVELGLANLDLAALLSVELLAVTAVILAIESRLRSDDPLYSSGNRSSSTVRLGKWRWPAILFPASVALTAIVVPVTVLLLWLQRDNVPFGRYAGLAFEWQYAFNSAMVAGIAAVLAAVVGLPVAYLAARRNSRFSGLLERATYVGYAVPGVVLGLALVFFGARYTGSLYRSGAILLPLLVFAYVVRFLPQSVGSTRASILQVDPQLPEAARSLGRSRLGTFRKITFPLVAPGLLAGAALVFLTAMKELPATLLLKPSEFTTLATHIWSVQDQGYYGYAAVPALVLLAISGVSMIVLLKTEGGDVG
jgi:iron(III) transport system permease protein